MQSPIPNSSRNQPSASQTVRRPVVRRRGPLHLTGSNSNSNRSSPSPISPKMESNWESENRTIDQKSIPETKKIMRNSLYLTFNAPRVDDYHRGIFLSNPPTVTDVPHRCSGSLHHATYAIPTDAPPGSPRSWFPEERPVNDISTATTLVLLYRLGTLDPNSKLGSIEDQCSQIRTVLNSVPLGRKNRESQLGPLAEGEGNPVLDGYDCIIWTIDAMNALAKANLISMADLDCNDGAHVMAKARERAGPVDAKSMVGKDFGGLTVINDPRQCS
ncbi:uncharacterized protein RAG0_16136 [Rhynchosporium agropyri]|uniref:Uncharacterized protein n=1 Tax=Rhynchosporium agropyri TaxID=914238 RepID=A0A1E1LP22_9HELO|nr:uncharacterized protein RAG0_16136 [Rhynchosporium agropyri]